MRCGQFTRCIHVSPIILEAAGFPEPKMGDGIAQEPMDGTSFEFSFDDPAAPERHTMQHFEMWGIGLSRPMDAG
jgi:arylsulfatase A-like enzyme